MAANKTLTVKTPKIKKTKLKHFYRGIFDGDGWITNRKSKSRSTGDYCKTGLITWEVGFSSGSPDFIKEIKLWINKAIGRDCGYIIRRSRKSNTQKVCQLTFGGNILFQEILSFLYKKTSVFLDRKHQIAKEAVFLIAEHKKKKAKLKKQKTRMKSII